MGVIEKNMRAYGLDEDKFMGREGWKGKIQIDDPIYTG